MRLKSLLVGALLGVVTLPMVAVEDDEVMMTIGGKPVTVGEFRYVYNKNAQNEGTTKSNFDEYLEKFVDYKLKVVAAENEGLDTTQSFRRELGAYRAQLAQNYLADNEKIESLIQEAYDRLQEDVEVSHILIIVPADATPDDTLVLYQQALDIRKGLTPSNFEETARKVSQDRMAAQNGGYLGWITSMLTIYPFETAVYNQEVGTISQPIRTQVGYHIVYVKGRRPSVGEVHVAHIMKACNDRMTKEEQEVAKFQIDSIYALLLKGGDFEKLARENSDDHASGQNGGDLPWFGLGRMVKDFENVAFAGSEKGSYSEPFKSTFGWHIIKYIDTRKLSLEDKRKDIEKALMRDGRMELAKRSFVDGLKKEYNCVVYSDAIDEVGKVVSETKELNDSAVAERILNMDKPIVTFADKTALQRDLAIQIPLPMLRANFEGQVNVAIDAMLRSYEESRLEEKYPDFRNLMQEYHDGILLFELSNREVWEKAAKDTTALRNYFEEHRGEYCFEKPRFKGYVISCKDKNTAKLVKRVVSVANADSVLSYVNARFNTGSVPAVKVERGLWSKGDRAEVDYYTFKVKKVKLTKNDAYPVVFTQGDVIEVPENYKDMRGKVISDYQNYLDAEWVKSLKEKYAVEMKETIVEALRKESK